MTENRLFVPLNTEPYEHFVDGTKDVELRGVNSRFNPETVTEGRPVELRKGYSHEPVWGTVGESWLFEHLANIPIELDHERIVPGTDRSEFTRRVRSILGPYDFYIAFEVRFCPDCGTPQTVKSEGDVYALVCPDCGRYVDAWGVLVP